MEIFWKYSVDWEKVACQSVRRSFFLFTVGNYLCGTADKISGLWLHQNYPVYVPVLYQSFKTELLIQDEKNNCTQTSVGAKFGREIVELVWTVLWMYQLDLVFF